LKAWRIDGAGFPFSAAAQIEPPAEKQERERHDPTDENPQDAHHEAGSRQ